MPIPGLLILHCQTSAHLQLFPLLECCAAFSSACPETRFDNKTNPFSKLSNSLPTFFPSVIITRRTSRLCFPHQKIRMPTSSGRGSVSRRAMRVWFKELMALRKVFFQLTGILSVVVMAVSARCKPISTSRFYPSSSEWASHRRVERSKSWCCM